MFMTEIANNSQRIGDFKCPHVYVKRMETKFIIESTISLSLLFVEQHLRPLVFLLFIFHMSAFYHIKLHALQLLLTNK